MSTASKKYYSTRDAARILKITIQRVRQILVQLKIDQKKFAGRYVINEENLEKMRGRQTTPGRKPYKNKKEEDK